MIHGSSNHSIQRTPRVRSVCISELSGAGPMGLVGELRFMPVCECGFDFASAHRKGQRIESYATGSQRRVASEL
jgi:hypothetical protein